MKCTGGGDFVKQGIYSVENEINVLKVDIPVPGRDVTYQTLPGRE
jgi:hypothetical protein